ncbi:MAG TPA: hypothetical protein VF008_12690, partial [Niastella sp.]
METFLKFIEIVFFYGFSIYLILKKDQRSIFYLPALFFIEKIVGAPSPAWLFYGIVSLLVIVNT